MACSKVRYEQREDAKMALRQLKGNGRNTKLLRPYRCSDCRFWHLGHLSPEVVRGDRSRGQVYREER